MRSLIFAVLTVPLAAADPAISRLMNEGDVAGLSIATLRDGKVASVTPAGVRNVIPRTLVTAHTIFEAASLSKPVFAYAVLQLVDAGKLSLDEPISKHLPRYVSDDDRAAAVTPRQILSHTAGFPNWRNPDFPMKTHFAPGERFSYSGEGYVYLQRAVEKITGEPLDTVMKRLVFDPLEMRDSSYVWQSRFDSDHADPHNGALQPGVKFKPTEANAAASLHTTAADFARFLEAAMSGARLKQETAETWFRPAVRLGKRCSQCLDPAIPDTETGIAWALGWGLEPDQDTFFHWGDNGAFKCFVIGSRKTRTAAVLFTNSAAGLSILPELMQTLAPGDHPAFRWLRYERYDTTRKLLFRSALIRGIEAAWRDLDGTQLDEGDRLATARELLDRNRLVDALWLRERIAAEFPKSSRAHLDLSESYLIARRRDEGAREAALAAEIDPKNNRAARVLKALRDGLFPTPSADGRVTLRLKGHLDAKQVSTAGNFNVWETRTLPLARDAAGWIVKFDLPPGEYQYRFVVDGIFMPDPDNPRHEDEKNPRSVSLLTVSQP